MGWFSYQREGTATTEAPSMSLWTPLFGTSPRKRTLPGATVSARRRSRASSEPVPATSRRPPGSRPMARIATSTPFSGESRPATRTGPPGELLTAMQRVSMKCGRWRSRAGKTRASAIFSAMNRLGQMSSRTGE